MIQFEMSKLIDRPVQDVFAFVSNPMNLPRWQAMVKEIQPAVPGSGGPGAKFNTKAEAMGRKIEGVMEITEYEPTTRFGFKMTAGPMRVTATVTLKPVGSGVKLTLNAQGEPGGMFKLAEGMLANQVKSQMEGNLERLKTVLESGV